MAYMNPPTVSIVLATAFVRARSRI